ncbi:MAG: oligosaccharide flippase family protein [Hyphomicrobiaceae bacterium]
MSVKSLVKSTLLLGSSSAANALVGILRVKALALLVGPAGLGLLGTLSGLATVGTTLFAVGADTSGTRRLALDRDDPESVYRLRRLMLLIAAIHGAASIALFWLIAAPLSRWAFGSDAYAGEVATLGFVVAVSLLAGLQIAVLQGLGRVRDIARIGLTSSIISTALGLAAVWEFGIPGVIVLLLAQPLLSALLAARLAPAKPEQTTLASNRSLLLSHWRDMMREGAPFMLSYLALAFMPLGVRALVIRTEGLEAAGHFHAAWTMSVIYVGFLLNAMSADYFPRLTGVVSDKAKAISLMNDQITVGIIIGGPALLLVMATAPWIVPLLYSKAFGPAVAIVEWQALGNLMKIAGWPIAFLSMARGRSKQFLALELAWTSLFLLLVWAGLPVLGLEATGMAFAASCTVFLFLQTVVAWKTFGFTLRRDVVLIVAGYVATGVVILAAARESAGMQAAVGATAAVVLGLAGLRHMLAKTGVEGRIGAGAARMFARLGWPVAPPSAHSAH